MRRKIYRMLIMTVCLSLLCGCGQTQDEPVPAAEATSGQRLIFSVVEKETPGYTVEALEGVTDNKMIYMGLSEVNVTLRGMEVPFAQALREGMLTVPEVFAFARIDGENGHCEEKYWSENGLTCFSYTYPQCKLELKYDVYETPDGQQHLIEEICVSDIPRESTIRGRSRSYYVDPESQWGYFIDREDWGLTFELAEATPDQVVLNCTQSGGQQLGALSIEGYYLYATGESPQILPTYIGKAFGDAQAVPFGDPAQGLPIAIAMDSAGQITIDWAENLGSLEPGDYYIQLSIADIYDEKDVHPLMRNFYDKQSYHIPFQIA